MNSRSPANYVFGVWENKTAQDIATSSAIYLLKKNKYFLFEIKCHIYLITLPVVNEVKYYSRENKRNNFRCWGVLMLRAEKL